MAESLLTEELAGSLAKAYSYARLRFLGYCEEVGKAALLAGVDTVVTYLAMVCEKVCGFSDDGV